MPPPSIPQRIHPLLAIPTTIWGIVACAGIVLWSQHFPFFWDDITLSSKYANWFYTNNFSALVPPRDINSGNPPLFGLYLAAIWKIFGKSLVVSHWAIFPLLVGIVIYYQRIVAYFFPHRAVQYIAILLLIIEPTFLAQTTLVTPEHIYLLALLGCISGLLYGNTVGIIVWSVLLVCTSTRGNISLLFLGMLDFWLRYKQPQKIIWTSLLKYLPAVLCIGIWYYLQYRAVGWVGYNTTDMGWAYAFEWVGVAGILKNGLILAWRLLDFGRVFVWLAILLAIHYHYKQNTLTHNQQAYQLAAIGLLFLAVMGGVMLPFSGLMQHRYLICTYWFVALCGLSLIMNIRQQVLKVALLLLTIFGLLSGHLWQYPIYIKMGWEASLRYIPYYRLHDQMTAFILSYHLSPADVCTHSPIIHPYPVSALRDHITWTHCDLEEVPLNQAHYVLETNVSNEFSDAERAQLQTYWVLMHEVHKRGVYIRLYKNPNNQ